MPNEYSLYTHIRNAFKKLILKFCIQILNPPWQILRRYCNETYPVI